MLDVPKEQYEAAALDGVNPWQRFRYVTLPNISPVLMFAAITGVIAALQYFTEAVVAASVASGQATTGGGNAALLGYPEGSAWFPYASPALFSMTAAFITIWLVSLTDRSAQAQRERALFHAQQIRSETGLGASSTSAH